MFVWSIPISDLSANIVKNLDLVNLVIRGVSDVDQRGDLIHDFALWLGHLASRNNVSLLALLPDLARCYEIRCLTPCEDEKVTPQDSEKDDPSSGEDNRSGNEESPSTDDENPSSEDDNSSSGEDSQSTDDSSQNSDEDNLSSRKHDISSHDEGDSGNGIAVNTKASREKKRSRRISRTLSG